MVREERCLDPKHAGFVVAFFKLSHASSKAIQLDSHMSDEGDIFFQFFIFPGPFDTSSTFSAGQHFAVLKVTLVQNLVDALMEPLKTKGHNQLLTFMESMDEFIVSQSPRPGSTSHQLFVCQAVGIRILYCCRIANLYLYNIYIYEYYIIYICV